MLNAFVSSLAHRKWSWEILIAFRQTQVESKEHESSTQGKWQLCEMNTHGAYKSTYSYEMTRKALGETRGRNLIWTSKWVTEDDTGLRKNTLKVHWRNQEIYAKPSVSYK